MSDDTDIGGPSGRFPETRWSAIQAARSSDPTDSRRGLEAIIGSYWKPVYKYIRIHDYKQTEEADACRVTFDYRFLAHSPARNAISAGIGRATLVLGDLEGDGRLSIIGEFGSVRCRGLNKFARSRC